MIETVNHGPLILSSTFWGSDYEQAGKLFVSVNAGAIRVMVPRSQRGMIEELVAQVHAPHPAQPPDQLGGPVPPQEPLSGQPIQ